MARLQLSGLGSRNPYNNDNLIGWVSSLYIDGIVYIPAVGYQMLEYIPSNVYLLPLTTNCIYPEYVKSVSSILFSGESVYILNGSDDFIFVGGFMFYQTRNSLVPICGLFNAYESKGKTLERNGNRYFIFDFKFVNNMKNLKAKNFILGKLIPYLSEYKYGMIIYSFPNTFFSNPSFTSFDNVSFDCKVKNGLLYNRDGNMLNRNVGILNIMALLKELEYICDKRAINAIKERIPDYMFELSESELKSLDLPPINQS